jgi:BirA family transcriptional regulator, biotin operon repressor / biotin---[acetyl-CoA-carboxylase] ligase
MTALTHWYDIWSAEGFAPIRSAWLERSHGLGAEVEVSNVGDPSLRGRFTGITEDGRLLLELSDGVTEMISAGTLGFVEQVEA